MVDSIIYPKEKETIHDLIVAESVLVRRGHNIGALFTP